MNQYPIVVNVRSYQECKGFLKKRNCWSTCYHCKQFWAQIDTVNVTMIHIEAAKGIESRFVCDGCL